MKSELGVITYKWLLHDELFVLKFNICYAQYSKLVAIITEINKSVN
jgi:hypothetical protein